MATSTHSGLLTQLTAVGRLQSSAGNPEWDNFYQRYVPYIRGICGKKLRNPADVDEAVSRVLIQVVTQITDYDPEVGHFRAWLKTRARARAIEVARDFLLREKKEGNPTLKPKTTKPGPLTILILKDDLQTIMATAVTSTKEKVAPLQWQIFDCSWLREWKVERVCKVLGVTPNQVSLARHRIKPIFARELKSAADEAMMVSRSPLKPTSKKIRLTK